MRHQCKLVLHWRPIRIQHYVVIFKLQLQNEFMWQYHEISLDVKSDSASPLNSSLIYYTHHPSL